MQDAGAFSTDYLNSTTMYRMIVATATRPLIIVTIGG